MDKFWLSWQDKEVSKQGHKDAAETRRLHLKL